MDTVAISVAPVGGWGRGNGNPLLPEEISNELAACAREGASVYHVHARNTEGNLTRDLDLLKRTAELVSARCSLILEASTGGLSDMNAEERAFPVTVKEAKLGSLNMGSVNFGDKVYMNSLPDIRLWIDQMKRHQVKPSLEIFDTGNLETALALIEDGTLTLPCNFSFVFDAIWGMPYDPALLEYLKGRLPEGCRWGAIFFGSTDFTKHRAAADAGAAIVRTGFEDSRRYDGKSAQSNSEMVAALRDTLDKAGFHIATFAESTEMLLG